MISREERMKLHAEFMCAALTALMNKATRVRVDTVQDNISMVGLTARLFAEAALIEYEKRWEEKV